MIGQPVAALSPRQDPLGAYHPVRHSISTNFGLEQNLLCSSVLAGKHGRGPNEPYTKGLGAT